MGTLAPAIFQRRSEMFWNVCKCSEFNNCFALCRDPPARQELEEVQEHRGPKVTQALQAEMDAAVHQEYL